MYRTFFYRIPVVRHKFIRVYSSCCRRQKGKPASCAGCDYCGREPALPAFSTDAHPPRMRLCCLVFMRVLRLAEPLVRRRFTSRFWSLWCEGFATHTAKSRFPIPRCVPLQLWRRDRGQLGRAEESCVIIYHDESSCMTHGGVDMLCTMSS